MGRLDGKGAVVTGGAGGIGKAIAAAFAKEGAAVAIVDLEQAAADAAMADTGAAIAIAADVTNLTAAEAMAASAINALGQVNIVVANAGVSGRGRLADIDEAMIDRVIGVNVKGVILTAKAFAEHLTGIGKTGGDANIINMSSQAGRKGWPELTVYSASKAAVMGFSRGLAVELAPYVRTNTICPGYIRDAGMLWRNWAAESDAAGKAHGKLFAEQNWPLARLQGPEDVANAAVFLASEEAQEITGQAINVSGGVVMD